MFCLFNLLPFWRSRCRRRLGILKSLIPTTSITNSALLPLPPLPPPLLTVVSEVPRNNQQKGKMKKMRVSWTITQPIELTITRFPGLFHFNPTHKLSRNSMKKPQRKTRAHKYFYDSSSSSLLSTHVLITLFGSPSPNLVVLLIVTKLCRVGLVKLSYKGYIFAYLEKIRLWQWGKLLS